MGVKVQLDQTVCQSSASKTSGLLLGTATHQLRILYLVPTPKSPQGTPPHRWAVEHANLVRPMCPGGLSILGTYLPLRGTSASPTKHVHAAAAIARDVTAQHDTAQPSLVLCRGPKGRVIVKQVTPNSDDPLKTADLKEVPNLANDVVSIRANLSIPQILFPIISNFTTPAELKSACSAIAEKLASASILQLPDDLHTVVTTIDDNRSLAEAMGWQTVTKKPRIQSSFSHEPIQVRLLTPICVDGDQLDSATTDRSEDETALSSLHGSLHLEAVATLDATVGDVLKVLQVDLVRSVRTRVDLVVESYLPDDDDGSDSEEHWHQPTFSLLPARVVASPVSATLHFLSLTEYLMPEESVDEDLTSRFLEAFSWDPETLEDFSVEQKEEHHPEPNEKGEGSSPISPQTDTTSERTSSANNTFDIESVMQFSFLVALVLGILAIVVKQILDYW